jgi:hypothetical protein
MSLPRGAPAPPSWLYGLTCCWPQVETSLSFWECVQFGLSLFPKEAQSSLIHPVAYATFGMRLGVPVGVPVGNQALDQSGAGSIRRWQTPSTAASAKPGSRPAQQVGADRNVVAPLPIDGPCMPPSAVPSAQRYTSTQAPAWGLMARLGATIVRLPSWSAVPSARSDRSSHLTSHSPREVDGSATRRHGRIRVSALGHCRTHLLTAYRSCTMYKYCTLSRRRSSGGADST